MTACIRGGTPDSRSTGRGGCCGRVGRGVSLTEAARSRVFEGQGVSVVVSVAPADRACVLSIRYRGGRTDRLGARAVRGLVSWTVRIPDVPPGPALVVAACGASGSA